MTDANARAAARKVDLLVLNAMAGDEFGASLARQRAWGLARCDLKDRLFGRRVEDLDPDQARAVRRMADGAGMGIACLSSGIGGSELGEGEAAFRAAVEPALARLVASIPILRPRLARLLWPAAADRDPAVPAAEWIARRHPWLLPLLRQAVSALAATGVQPVFENECGPCLVRSPADAADLVAAVGGGAKLIWDVQNLWQASGRLPRLEDYAVVRPHLAAIHLKGGRHGGDGGRLVHATGLAAAHWPILPILRAAVADGAISCICLNPSHGAPHPDPALRQDPLADLDFIRAAIPETRP
jgi:hypothetical protein